MVYSALVCTRAYWCCHNCCLILWLVFGNLLVCFSFFDCERKEVNHTFTNRYACVYIPSIDVLNSVVFILKYLQRPDGFSDVSPSERSVVAAVV